MKFYVIPTETLCNGKCDFCITKTREHINSEFLEPENLEKTLDMQRYISGIEITGGGEPLLNSRIEEIANICSDKAPTRMYTNGEMMHVHYSIADRLTELCISRSHNNEEMNASIMEVHYNLEEIVKNVKSKVKLSLMLDKKGVSTIGGLMKYLDWADSIGAYKVVVREMDELARIPKRFVSVDGLLSDVSLWQIPSDSANPLYKHRGIVVEFEECGCNSNSFSNIIRSDARVYHDWNSIGNK